MLPTLTECLAYPHQNLVSKRYGYFEESPSDSLIQGDAGLIVFDERFRSLMGTEPSFELIAEDATKPFAHEAGVYMPNTGDIFITSNHIRRDGKKHVQISKVTRINTAIAESDGIEDHRYEVERICTEPEILMANGGVNYKDGVLFCEQGSLTEPGGLTYMRATADPRTGNYTTRTLLSNYYGRWFNSVNDVIVAKNSNIWFTDPPYGYEQGIRPVPQLPAQTYCFDPVKGAVRAVDDSLKKPNGLCFSPDQKTLASVYLRFRHCDKKREPLLDQQKAIRIRRLWNPRRNQV
ncbi:hypothetical protein N0V83_008567 [Neocucurbitaria cava]|uniref:SMP-30/Gluconolactonase/LRE-like region domain-containing protein n=1 Tax=Neocucurbitaria cava TaxID=798079 RepID=A0A9W9CI31_9PLEO|nr:hypothetical protein N0V83_008567 [Neocucurbitaria cava]